MGFKMSWLLFDTIISWSLLKVPKYWYKVHYSFLTFFKMTNFEDLVFALTEANNGNELLQAIDEYLAQQSA